MNFFLIIVLGLLANPSQAQIFKCEDVKGQITYQDAPCENAVIQKEIIVQKLDPEITRQAIDSLKKDIQQRQSQEALKTLVDLKIQENISREALIESARQHTYALERNTEAHQQKIRQRNTYFSGYQPDFISPYTPTNRHFRKDSVKNTEDRKPVPNLQRGSKFIPKHPINNKHLKM